MVRIELLTKAHNREGFDCGSEALNAFLRQTARQSAIRGVSRTYVLVDAEASEPKSIVGYFALNICQVTHESFSPDLAKKFPRKAGAIRLGRLAVAKGYQGKGFGKILLVAAMEKCLEVSAIAGGIGLFVDAKDERAAAFYRTFDFLPLTSTGLEMFLPIASIQEALGRVTLRQ